MRVKAIEQFFARANYPYFPYLYPLLCYTPFHASHLPRHGLKNIYRPHQASFSFDSVSSLGLSQQLTVCRRGNSRYTEDTITRVTRRNGFQVAHACLLNHSRHRQARPLRRGKTITNSLSCTPQKTHEENLPCHSHPQKTSTSNTVLSKWNLHKPSCRAFVANTIWTPTTTVL